MVQMNRVNEAYAKERQLTEQIGGYQRQIAELQEQLRARWVLRAGGDVERRRRRRRKRWCRSRRSAWRRWRAA